MKHILVLVLWLGLGGFAHAGQGLDALSKFLEGLESLQAGFTQSVLDTEQNRAGTYEGVLFLQRPGRFRWEYLSPYKQSIIADGDDVWVVDEDLEQITKQSEEKALRGTPALLLIYDQPIDTHFEAVEIGQHLGMAWVELIPKDPEGQFERIQMAFADGQLDRMEMRDRYGQISRFNFYKLQRNPELDPELFVYEVPEGSDLFVQ